MTSIDRTAYPRFARRLSEEELEERYDLTPAERRFLASNARTGSAYLTLAVMLKTRQQLGHFSACSKVPDQVRHHLVDRLGLPGETPLLDEVRQKKGLHLCRQRIRARLESVPFVATGRAEIRARVRDAAHIMSDPADLLDLHPSFPVPPFRGVGLDPFDFPGKEGRAPGREPRFRLREGRLLLMEPLPVTGDAPEHRAEDEETARVGQPPLLGRHLEKRRGLRARRWNLWMNL